MTAYSTSTVANRLGTSSRKVRVLCRAGAIESHLNPAGRYQIPEGELKRLQTQGLPALPSTDSTTSRPTGGGLRNQASPAVMQASDRVKILQAEVAALTLERQKVESLDFFSQREAQAARQREAEQAHRHQQMEAEREERRRARWLAEQITYASYLLPPGVPSDILTGLPGEIEELLLEADLGPESDNWVVWQLINTRVEEMMSPVRARQMLEDIITEAVGKLPLCAKSYVAGQPSAWEQKARTAAMEGMLQIQETAETLDDLRVAAEAAVMKVGEEFEASRQ